MIKLTIIPLYFAIIICSCTELSDLKQDNNQIPDNVVIISEDSFMRDTIISSTHGKFGKYARFYDHCDATIGISSSRYYPLGDETIMAFYEPSGEKKTKVSSEDEQAFGIQINGINVFAPVTRSGTGTIARLFGHQLSFNLPGINSSTRSSDDSSLYAPEIVRIESPSIESAESRYPLCYFKRFIVRWNRDVLNANGVIILVKWNGTMVFGEDYPSSCVFHSVCVPDNGCVELDESMFDGIPDAAFCHLFVLRGDVNNVDVNGTTFRLLAESHDVLDFILVRNIK